MRRIVAQGPGATLLSPSAHPLHLALADSLHLRVRFLTPSIVRVFVGAHDAEATSHVCVADGGDVPWQGRPLEDHSRFPDAVAVAVKEHTALRIVLASSIVQVTVHLETHLRLSMARVDTGDVFYEDVAHGAYVFDACKARHVCIRHADEEFYGLGEASGPLNRARRRYRIDAKDAMGYDADSTDPLCASQPHPRRNAR